VWDPTLHPGVQRTYMRVDVSAEAFGTSGKLLGPGSILGLNTEV
jgi:hypothetical protein